MRRRELPVTLKRGVARFDLQLRTAGVASVKGITLKNAAQSAYLFPVEGDLSPADVTRQDAVAAISEPLTKDTQAVLYVYEQENDGLEIVVEAEIDGKTTTLRKDAGLRAGAEQDLYADGPQGCDRRAPRHLVRRVGGGAAIRS